MNINEVVSKELQIEPLKEGQIKEFMLVNAGVFDPSSNRVVSPQGWGTPGQCMIKDPGDKKNPTKLILNVDGYEPVRGQNGITFMNPIVKYLRFDATGRKVCTHENNNEYFFLKLHNKNRDNKNRIKTAPVRFFEIDEARDSKILKSNFEYKTMAAVLLMESTPDEVFKVARLVNKKPAYGVTIDLNKEPDYMATALQPVVENFPADFIRLHGDKRSNLRLLVDAAIEEGIILFNEHEAERKWLWKRTPGTKGAVTICKVIEGNKPVPALIDFLQTGEGGAHLAELKQRQSEYYSVMD